MCRTVTFIEGTTHLMPANQGSVCWVDGVARDTINASEIPTGHFTKLISSREVIV